MIHVSEKNSARSWQFAVNIDFEYLKIRIQYQNVIHAFICDADLSFENMHK